MKLRPTEQRIYDVLADGNPHSGEDLLLLLFPEALVKPDPSFKATLHVHISNLRKAISAEGLDVVARGHNGKTSFCLMRRLSKRE